MVAAFALRLRDPSGIVGSVVAGTLTANFLGPAAAHYAPDWIGGGTSFIVGLCAMVICQGLITAVRLRFRKMVDQAAAEKTP